MFCQFHSCYLFPDCDFPLAYSGSVISEIRQVLYSERPYRGHWGSSEINNHTNYLELLAIFHRIKSFYGDENLKYARAMSDKINIYYGQVRSAQYWPGSLCPAGYVCWKPEPTKSPVYRCILKNLGLILLLHFSAFQHDRPNLGGSAC